MVFYIVWPHAWLAGIVLPARNHFLVNFFFLLSHWQAFGLFRLRIKIEEFRSTHLDSFSKNISLIYTGVILSNQWQKGWWLASDYHYNMYTFRTFYLYGFSCNVDYQERGFHAKYSMEILTHIGWICFFHDFMYLQICSFETLLEGRGLSGAVMIQPDCW